MGAWLIHDGDRIDYTPPGDVAAGDVVVVGPDLIGVAVHDIKAGQMGSLRVVGVFDFPKATAPGNTVTAGINVYWNPAQEKVWNNHGGGTNQLLGRAVDARTFSDPTVRVRMKP